MKTRKIACALIGLSALVALPALADSYPSKPVKIVVGAAPGGPNDMVARMLGEQLSRSTGGSFVVENRGGGGGVIAATHVARSDPDGYTLLMGAVSTHGITPSLYKNLEYDPIKDFTPISQVVTYPLVMVVNAGVPAQNLSEFIDYAKQNGSKVMRASSGNGSSMHLAGDMFNSAAGTELYHVPYKGSAPAVLALLANDVHVNFESIPLAFPHVQSGKLRALGVTGKSRISIMPDTPTISESLPGYEISGWFGLLAPKGTPQSIIDRLHAEVVKALEEPELKKSFDAQIMETVGSSPEEFRIFIDGELSKFAKVVKESGATVE